MPPALERPVVADHGIRGHLFAAHGVASTRSDVGVTRTPLRPHHSLRWRLPLLISALITAVLATFLWVAYRGVERTLIDSAGVRAQGVADQLGSLMAQSAQQRRNEVQ